MPISLSDSASSSDLGAMEHVDIIAMCCTSISTLIFIFCYRLFETVKLLVNTLLNRDRRLRNSTRIGSQLADVASLGANN